MDQTQPSTKKKKKKIPVHYVEHEKFQKLFFEWKTEYIKLYGTQKKQILPFVEKYEQIATNFRLIAIHYSDKPRWINYSYDWKQDMISLSVARCLEYADTFDPWKISELTGQKSNPFSYFTSVITNGFKQKVAEEYKQKKLKMNIALSKGANHMQLLDMNNHSIELTEDLVKENKSKARKNAEDKLDKIVEFKKPIISKSSKKFVELSDDEICGA